MEIKQLLTELNDERQHVIDFRVRRFLHLRIFMVKLNRTKFKDMIINLLHILDQINHDACSIRVLLDY